MSYLVDYHTHPAAHGDIERPAYTEEYLLRFIKRAEERGIKELGFSDHERYFEQIDRDLLDYLKENTPLKILLGLEFNYRPGREEEIKWLQETLSLDYSIGSVHYIDDWEFDHPDNIAQYQLRNLEEVFKDYFLLLREAAATDLFPVIGHLDLIKVFGFKPVGLSVISLVEPVLQEIKKKSLAIEINSNGVNKPVGEYYPSAEILQRACELKIPVTFGSDAHLPGRTGEGIREAARLARSAGYHKVAVFENNRMRLKPLLGSG